MRFEITASIFMAAVMALALVLHDWDAEAAQGPSRFDVHYADVCLRALAQTHGRDTGIGIGARGKVKSRRWYDAMECDAFLAALEGGRGEE